MTKAKAVARKAPAFMEDEPKFANTVAVKIQLPKALLDSARLEAYDMNGFFSDYVRHILECEMHRNKKMFVTHLPEFAESKAA